jgi:hypothetical protein
MLTCCPAAASAEQVYGGSRFKQRIAGWLNAIHARNGVENDLMLLGIVLGSKRIERYRAEPQQRSILGPLDGGIIDCITFLGKLNEYLELDRSGHDSLEQLRAGSWASCRSVICLSQLWSWRQLPPESHKLSPSIIAPSAHHPKTT